MSIAHAMLGEFEHESKITRKFLERVPQDKLRWKPHEKSMEFGYLAALVATMPSWFQSMVQDAELDVARADGKKYTNTDFSTSAELLAGFEASVKRGRDALAGTNDEHLMTTWRMLARGHKVSEDPRHQVITDTFTHWAHHRGQLSVYLRLNNVPLASIYGPTADERMF